MDNDSNTAGNQLCQHGVAASLLGGRLSCKACSDALRAERDEALADRDYGRANEDRMAAELTEVRHELKVANQNIAVVEHNHIDALDAMGELEMHLRAALMSDRPWFETHGQLRAKAAWLLVGPTCTAFGCIEDPLEGLTKCERHERDPYAPVDRSYPEVQFRPDNSTEED